MNETILKEYNRWLTNAKEDKDLIKELNEMKNNKSLIEDAFYRSLAFGTGGLRGVIGAGTNRMNLYVIRKASQGLANYINKEVEGEKSIAISFDSRIKSTYFAHASAEVFAANGIKVYIYPQLMPTPCLSYAVRHLHCSAGAMVTASHNPSKYNGYKVYGNDGCQITDAAADKILKEIESLDIFNDIKHQDFDLLMKKGMISYIDEETYTSFIERVKKESMLENEVINKDVSIVYSPLNGTGLKPVTRILKESGYTNVVVVKEQENPDGNFPTCPYPNPEIRQAMELGIQYAKNSNADILIATDPDCDRVGIAVKDKNNEFVLLNGNQTGTLLLDYICSMRIKHNKMPKNPIFVTTIVSSEMLNVVARSYGVKPINVLTGFKYIGDQIKILEDKHEENSYIFGCEESYGYLSGTYVRDKDAVDGVFLIVEMFAYYKSQGLSLLDKLNELYNKFSIYSSYLNSYEFDGEQGFYVMENVMNVFRNKVSSIGEYKVEKILDYNTGLDGLPKSNVVKMYFKNGISIVARPSGTEPKLKIYFSINSSSKENNNKIYAYLLKEVEKIVKK